MKAQHGNANHVILLVTQVDSMARFRLKVHFCNTIKERTAWREAEVP
jgi:hypothetical protein